MRLVLASASPRRAELLQAAGFAFDVIVADVDETARPGEAAVDYVRRLAADKARAVAGKAGGRAVLGADTVVVVDGTILGKPAGEDDARRMLRMLSGRSHEVLTGVALIGEPDKDRPTDLVVNVEATTVEFAPLIPAEIDWYVASGESMDKAGGYAIQGLASRFVTRIDGSYSNVVGLPLSLVYRMCTEAAILIS